MFPTFISILDIQSWWEVPSVAHFCSLFRTSFNLLDFDIEDLEEALLTDGTEESSWLQELIVRLLSGCLPNNEISTFNYQMFLRRLFRQKCQEHDRYNPFNTDIDFQILPLRSKVDILHALCDFRLDADDVFDKLKNLEADSLRVEPLGFDGNESAYWYFYGTRLYREDYTTKNNKKKSVWQVICFTEDDWFQLTKKFKKSASKAERQLHHTLSENFLPELPRLFKEKESLARKRLLENQPRRTSNRLRKLECDTEKELAENAARVVRDERLKQEEEVKAKKVELEIKRQESYERRSRRKRLNEDDTVSETSSDYEMAGSRSKKSKVRRRKSSCSSTNSNDRSRKASKRDKKNDKNRESGTKSSISKPTTVGRQTNNSLSAATGQILIQPVTNPNKKKLKTSQVFRQTDEDLQTGMHKILDYVKNSEDAWPFADPVEEEYAPNYYTVIRKPMDLQRMEERLDSGYYKNFHKFRADFQLIVDNCRLYNGAENEYTEMVGNLLQVFEKATDKYLDQISSSDDEIAIEFAKEESVRSAKSKQVEEVTSTTSTSRRKPMLAAQTDRKRDKSEDSVSSARSDSYDSLYEEEVVTKPRSRKRSEVSESFDDEKRTTKSGRSKICDPEEPESKKYKPDTTKKEAKKDKPSKKDKEGKKATSEVKNKTDAKDKLDAKRDKAEKKKNKHDAKKTKADKKSAKSKEKKANKKEKKKLASSRSASRSPPPSCGSSPPPSWPPSSPDSRFDIIPREDYETRQSRDMVEMDDVGEKDAPPKPSPFEDYFHDFEESLKNHDRRSKKEEQQPLPLSFSPKPKDKHNKLRETIEKLKAKSEMKLQIGLEFELDPLKENKDKNKKPERDDKIKPKVKEKVPQKIIKKDVELDMDGNSTMDSVLSDGKKTKKLAPKVVNVANKNSSNMDALSIATEQTLKDINKWLDDTPKFSEFSSASNSPSYGGLDEFDPIAKKSEQVTIKKLDKPPPATAPLSTPLPAPKKDGKDAVSKKRSFRDPTKFFKRREVQRTIDRLQPGKGKGNLIANVSNSGKVEETFALGALSKLKDTKNSLIVRTDTNAPKLSLGSVLDSFGKHKFVDDQKKESVKPSLPTAAEHKEETSVVATDAPEGGGAKKELVAEDEVKETKADKEPAVVEDAISGGGATPNLSAWFKAFGAPKIQPPAKKSEDKVEVKGSEKSSEDNKFSDARKVPVPAASPTNDVSAAPPQGPAMPRQRRVSTGSSMSERSSFSQDLDSPRVGMDERGAYPAPYPSPLHRSPSGASPVMASPRPDISPKSAAYPTINGQMRVGFYQDTVSSNKSSPDKSCSPRENPTHSPYPHYSSEHVYAPNTTENAYYSYANSPYYTHAAAAPNYSSAANPTPPYQTPESSSYYDASSAGNYTANSPSSNAPSPANVHQQQHSPGMYSQHSPTILAPRAQNSPAAPETCDSPAAQVALPEQSPILVQSSPEAEERDKPIESQQREYAEEPTTQIISKQRFEIDPRLTQQLEMKRNHQAERKQQQQQLAENKPYVHQNIPDPKVPSQAAPVAKQLPTTRENYATPSSSSAFGSFGAETSNFSLNIPSARALANVTQQAKMDLSQYTNMGYTGPEVQYTRSLQQFSRSELNYTATSAPTSQKLSTAPTSNTLPATDISMRYGDPTAALQQMNYKGIDLGGAASNTQRQGMDSSTARSNEIGERLSHIVDRFGSEEQRMIAGLQNAASSFYADKALSSAAAHMFNKPIATSASALPPPIFSQSNMAAAMQSYGQNVQAAAAVTTSMYDRQLSELQNDLKAASQQMQQAAHEKKNKKRKSGKIAGAIASESQQQTTPNQGFQSYMGLKGTTSIEPSAISLKTSSVVPGSAFNFGPTPSGLGIASGLYAEKDAYPNFLDEFRSAPNFYMAAAAAAHHRATPETTEKQTRPAHQNSNPQSSSAYPFLGAPQATRSGYSIGSPFIPNAQAQLMDTSSPLYQHYLQAGVLNQGLLGPPGAYPPAGYHPALAMRQPYESMTRPPWL